MNQWITFAMSRFTIALIGAVVILVAVIIYLLFEMKKLSNKEKDNSENE